MATRQISSRGARQVAVPVILFVAFGLFLFPGCGNPTGLVTGKVTVKGKPLAAGTVTFASADGSIRKMSKIGPEGTYSVLNMPTGMTKIGVIASSIGLPAIVPEPAPGVKLPPELIQLLGQGQASKVSIPDHYEDPEKSGLSLEVTGGEQSFDIDIP